MNVLLEELTAGLSDGTELLRVLIRLLGAMLAGAVLGLQRERADKPAGWRTHILVALGAALFVVVPSQLGMDHAGLSRVVQGVATGIGFLGGGVILKLASERRIEGLTTAADIWATAAIGVAIGLGALGIGLIATAFAWIVLSVLYRVEVRGGNPR
ncbi:MAG TPA: MgtC/SapB family protein [Rhodanobacteraceae bacterium]|jgi:putative Mg2+ transporter-C (MgtC) family protein|nr:MgtC/SapB family protein [Rhodanobacteraceae bacterium]